MLLIFVSSVALNECVVLPVGIRQIKMKNIDWLLFFYTVPAKPVGSRTKIWRKLSKIGAVKLKGTAYLLPYSDQHHEILQWLISELSSLGGEGALVRTDTVEPLGQSEIISLFDGQCAKLYHKLLEGFDALERKIDILRQSDRTDSGKNLTGQLKKLQRKLHSVKKVDFFTSTFGVELENRMKSLTNEFYQLASAGKKRQSKADTMKTPLRKKKDYQGKTWVTRKNPFVDRMASAWLIRKFIDNQAVFAFIDDKDLKPPGGGIVTFDIKNGDFTHTRDLCTLEILIISFDLGDRVPQHISNIVHNIDLQDDKYRSPEADGIEMILSGVRNSVATDSSALEKGMDLFEALYASFT